MIELHGVTKIFNAGQHNQFTAVSNVSLVIRQGQLTILKGPSGSGKTSLLSIIGCMSRPSSGRIKLYGIDTSYLNQNQTDEGIDISSLPERFLTEIRRKAFGFIFQQFNLVRGISALENIMLPAYPTGERQSLFRARAKELMKMLSIERHYSSPVEWLSGGEQQRVAIARSLINDPKIIIADEPTAHLDSRLSQEFLEITGQLKSQGKTVIIASHDPLVYESGLCDAVVEMRDGCIIRRELAQ